MPIVKFSRCWFNCCFFEQLFGKWRGQPDSQNPLQCPLTPFRLPCDISILKNFFFQPQSTSSLSSLASSLSALQQAAPAKPPRWNFFDKDTPSSLQNTLSKSKLNCLMKRSWLTQTLLAYHMRLPVRHGLPILVCTNEKTCSKVLWLQSLSYNFFHWSRPHVGV